MLSVSVVMLGRQWLHYAVKGAISLQIDVLGSEWIKKVHRGSEVIEIRKFCPPNQIRAFLFFAVPRLRISNTEDYSVLVGASAEHGRWP